MMRSPMLCSVVMTMWLSVERLDGQVIVEATKIDGQTVQGQWMPSGEGGKIAVGSQNLREVFSTHDLISLRIVDSFVTPLVERWTVTLWLQNGSIFPADIVDGGSTHLVLKTPFGQDMKIPLSDIAAILWNNHDLDPELIEAHLAEGADRSDWSAQDRLIALPKNKLRTVQGTISSVSSDGGTFTFKGKSLNFDVEKTVAVLFAKLPNPKAVQATCTLGEHFRMAGDIMETTADTVTVRSLAGSTVTLPILSVQEIRFESDRLEYLGDLTPSAIDQSTAFDIHWPVRFNQAVSTRPLSIAGEQYSRGIGVHAHSELTYELEANYSALAATIGIDDHVRPAGHVIFRVMGDGKELFNSGQITGRDEPRDMLVKLDGIRQIKLIVEQADQLDIGDHADWANIRLIK